MCSMRPPAASTQLLAFLRSGFAVAWMQMGPYILGTLEFFATTGIQHHAASCACGLRRFHLVHTPSHSPARNDFHVHSYLQLLCPWTPGIHRVHCSSVIWWFPNPTSPRSNIAIIFNFQVPILLSPYGHKNNWKSQNQDPPPQQQK